MTPTDIKNPNYFHKVVDCQWACPAHTPVPEYIRLIAAGRYADAYMVNWKSNVFPGILGRTCDRPCEPACRRGRVEKEPVAICRLKRVAADNKGEVKDRMPEPAAAKNGKRIALVGSGQPMLLGVTAPDRLELLDREGHPVRTPGTHPLMRSSEVDPIPAPVALEGDAADGADARHPHPLQRADLDVHGRRRALGLRGHVPPHRAERARRACAVVGHVVHRAVVGVDG